MLGMFVPHCLIMCVRNLKLFAPFSLAADVISFVTFGVAFYYIFQNLNESVNERTPFGRIRDFPLFYGTMMFSLQSISMTISIENNMETPESFRKPLGLLNIAFSTLTVVYLIVATFGYWRYGEDIKSSITMNFPPGDTLADVIIISYGLAIFISYGLNGYVPIKLILDVYLIPKFQTEISNRKKLTIEMSLRMAFVICTCMLSTTLPLLGLIISLCGSVGLSLLGVIFPGYLEISAYWEEEESTPKTFRFWKDIVIILIGIIGLITGIYATSFSMGENFSEKGTKVLQDL